MSLLVIGGNGFVGSAACAYAVAQGIDVYALCRSGQPTILGPWNDKVKYIKGDAMDTSSYKSIVKDCKGVIHSLGVLLDTKFFWKSEYKGSYEQVNRDSAFTAAELVKGTESNFVYLSASRGMFFSPRYLSTKQDVEFWLKTNQSIHSTVLQPGFMWREEDNPRRITASFINILNKSDALFDKAGWQKGKEALSPERALPVDVVGKAAVLSAMKPEFRGQTLGVDEMEEIASKY